jgi:hypothetical protein
LTLYASCYVELGTLGATSSVEIQGTRGVVSCVELQGMLGAANSISLYNFSSKGAFSTQGLVFGTQGPASRESINNF